MSAISAQFEHALIGQTMSIARREADWVFAVPDESCVVAVECAWRLRDGERVLLTDGDDGQQFGLPSPVDAEQIASRILKGRTVVGCSVRHPTADIEIALLDGVRLDILTNSSGYESWTATLGGNLIVGRGDGVSVVREQP